MRRGVFLLSDIPRSIMSLLRNKVYLVTCLGICCEIAIVSGFVVFLPKYLETQFGTSTSMANVFTGEKCQIKLNWKIRKSTTIMCHFMVNHVNEEISRCMYTEKMLLLTALFFFRFNF